MAKVLVALLRFSPKQQKELLRKVDEQVNQVSYFRLLGRLFMTYLFTVESFTSPRNSCLTWASGYDRQYCCSRLSHYPVNLPFKEIFFWLLVSVWTDLTVSLSYERFSGISCCFLVQFGMIKCIQKDPADERQFAIFERVNSDPL